MTGYWSKRGGLVRDGIIFLSVILAENLTDVFLAICAVTVGMQAGYFINFFLGKYGWYKLLLRFGLKKSIEDTQHKMERNGLRFLLFTYWHPGLGSVSATVAGILQFPVRKFFMFSLAAVVVWNVFWAGVVYFVGEQSITLFFSWPCVLTIIFVWTVVRFIGLVQESKKVSI
jgi:membrane protein DedA with SNARE-associated domain